MVKGLKNALSYAFCEVKCTPWSVSKVGQSGIQSVTHISSNKKMMEFFFVVKTCFVSYIIKIQGKMDPLKFSQIADRQ